MSIYIKFLIFFFYFLFSANAEEINEVKISGNKRISDETIMVLGNISLNKNINNDYLNNSLKNLYDTNFFKDITFNVDNNILSIAVIENPIIEEITIDGIKKDTLTETLYDAIKLKNRTSYTESYLKDDLVLIESILKQYGYYFAQINSSLKVNEDLNSVKINLNINLGQKAKIKEIVFLGDKKIKDKKLLELIASEEHKFWKFISNKVYLNQSLINLDKRLLENYYKNEGYYKVKVLNSFAEIDTKGFFKLIFNIDAGKKYYFNKFSLNLPEDYDSKDFFKIEKTFKKLENETYSLDKLNKILEQIDTIASSRLYDFINVEVSENIEEENKINFNFLVSDSEKFYVEKINILGNFNTIEDVLRNNFIVDEGDPFNQILYNKSINKIKSLNIFKKVDTEVIEGGNPNTRIINISVEEKPTGEISLGAGYGTDGSVLAGGITEKNFLGEGVTLNSNFEISSDSIKGSLNYAKPYFNNTDNTLITSIKSIETDNLTNSGYKISTVGFSLGTKFEQYENLYFSPEIDFSLEDLTTNSSASTSLKKQEGNYTDFYFNYNLDLDNRNSSYNPSSGSRFSFFQALPISSTNNEITNSLTVTKYIPFSTEIIGKSSFYFKAINSLDGSDVRISKRANMPYYRLRGFEKGKIGPKDNNEYVGGNYVSAINLSTNLPKLLSTFENIDFSYFIDIGNVWGVDYDSTINDSNFIRSSTGISMEYLSPVGPLSFSLTQPLTKKSTDKTEVFRFNLGTSF
jgi:outer membrane protein insertion porin family